MWPAVPAWNRTGDGAGRASHAPVRRQKGCGTCSSSSTEKRPRRAAWRTQRPAPCRRSARSSAPPALSSSRRGSRHARGSAWPQAPLNTMALPLTCSRQPWGMCAPGRHSPPPHRSTGRPPPPSALPVALLHRHPQESRDFFLDVDDRLRLPELQLEPLYLALEIGDSFLEGNSRVGLGPALAWRESVQLHRSLPLAPLGKTRGVEALPPQECAYLAVCLAGVGLGQDPQLVLGGEPAALRLFGNLGVRYGGRRFLGSFRPTGSLRPGTGHLFSPCHVLQNLHQ